jgi:hypothetical protein
MSSENPEIRHPTIPDSGDAEHRNMPNIVTSTAAKKKKYRRRTSHEDYFDKDGIIKNTIKITGQKGGGGGDGARR